MITTHVLDTSRGMPAAGVTIFLEALDGTSQREIGRGQTDADGRLRTLVPAGTSLPPGTYRLVFDTGSYFLGLGQKCFFPSVAIAFETTAGQTHYHVPLLLNPFGYSTYRGSLVRSAQTRFESCAGRGRS